MSDVEKIKQQYSCCAEDDLAYQKTEDSCPVETHTLPDGQVCLLIHLLMVMTYYDNISFT